MNAPDELAKVISEQFDVDRTGEYDSVAIWATPAEVADAILAAGYRKPRTITTTEELDALPDESIVRCRRGSTYEKFPDGDGLSGWMMIGYQRLFAGTVISLPATVLYEPEATK